MRDRKIFAAGHDPRPAFQDRRSGRKIHGAGILRRSLVSLPMDDRFTIANMAVETGAKTGLFVPDEKTLDWVKQRAVRDFEPVYPEEGARYEREMVVDVSGLTPLVALPHSPPTCIRPFRSGNFPWTRYLSAPARTAGFQTWSRRRRCSGAERYTPPFAAS